MTNMLKEVKKNYTGQDRESVKMNKMLLYAIEKLNSKRSIFEIDQINFSDDEEEKDLMNEPDFLTTAMPRKTRAQASSTYRRRHSVQVGTNWLQEYSSFNMN